MSFIKGALDALNNLFETIFSRLDALGDRAEALEGDFEKFALSLEEAATHAAQYAVDLALEDLDLEGDLCRAKSLQDDVESLKFSVHELENDMHPITCQDARIDSLERDIEGLKGEIQDALLRDNGLGLRIDALDNEIGEMSASLLTIRSYQFVEPSELEAVQDEVRALKDVVRGQDKTIKALLKALEWQPPKD